MLLSICPIIANAEVVDEEDANYGYISIKVTPMLGGFGEKYLRKNAASESSTIENITYQSGSTGKIVPEQTNYGFRVEATYYVNGAVSTDKKVYVYIQEEKPLDETDKIKSKSNITGIGTATHDFEFTDMTASVVYYITATTDDGNYAVNSVTVQVAHKASATSSAYYHRLGMQIRGVDDVPIGKYDYISSKGATKNVANTTGIYQTETGTFTDSNGQSYTLGTYEGLDGKEYPECYFDVKIDSLDSTLTDETGRNSIAGISNIKELYNWLGIICYQIPYSTIEKYKTQVV
jgi:hypothetical protein